ncbi:hypothetical protein Y032_0350g3212 [Ancylostoma ceylanicum]|uniref:Uncharacterized protein n=1 Tax=Ancylostoma ceylanicum TaxID=53326 RepID=A0A016RWV9_9BILA|nr:hypothetical protein Y032_0350g3212 [Ancylostoma ceylanicum]
MPALVVCFCQQQRTRVSCRSRQPEPACRVPVSLPKNAAPRSRPCLLPYTVYCVIVALRIGCSCRTNDLFDAQSYSSWCWTATKPGWDS